MADKKISQLTGASTPLAGSEVLPIVQSGSTVKVSVDNLTKGKTVNAAVFDTDVAAAGVTLSGTTLAADGTDTDININLTPKGAGFASVDGPLRSRSATNGGYLQLQRNTSSVTAGQNIGYIDFYSDDNSLGGPSTRAFVRAYAEDSFNRTTLSVGSSTYNAPVEERATWNSNGTFTQLFSSVFNENGGDYDFRVEGDNDANLLFVDASTDRIGVGTNTPTVKFDVSGDSSLNGAVVVNEAGADKDFRVEGDTNANMLFVDASADSLGVGTSSLSAWARATVDGQVSASNTLRAYTVNKTITTGTTTNFFTIGVGNGTVGTVQVFASYNNNSVSNASAISAIINFSKSNETAVTATLTQFNPSVSGYGGNAGQIQSIQIASVSGGTITVSLTLEAYSPNFNASCNATILSTNSGVSVAAA